MTADATAVAAARLPGLERYCAACHAAHQACPECGATILWSRIQRRWMECEGIETRAHSCPVSGVVLRSSPLPQAAPVLANAHAEWAWGELPARDRLPLVTAAPTAASPVRAAVAQGGGDGRGGMSRDGVQPTPRPHPAPDEQVTVVRGVQF